MQLVASQQVEIVERLRPPAELIKAEREEWVRIVDSMPADWFIPANQPLLVQLCRHVVMARQLSELMIEVMSGNDQVPVLAVIESLSKAQERQSRIINQLMTSLRLTPQAVQPSRTSAKTIRQISIRKPWE